MSARKRSARLTVALLLLALVSAQRAEADDLAFWPEVGIKGSSGDLLRKGNIQLRLRDNTGDLHYVRAEGGVGLQRSGLEIFGLYRYNPTKSGGNRHTAHYGLLDVTIRNISISSLKLHLRGRMQQRLGDQGRSFFKLRPHFVRKVSHSKLDSWFINNEFYFQTSALGNRSRINQNRAATGLVWSGAATQFTTYYTLRSDQPVSGAGWSHTHVIGLSVYLKR